MLFDQQNPSAYCNLFDLSTRNNLRINIYTSLTSTVTWFYRGVGATYVGCIGQKYPDGAHPSPSLQLDWIQIFCFSLTGCRAKVKENSLPYYLFIAGRRINVKCGLVQELNSGSRSISYDGNCYIMSALDNTHTHTYIYIYIYGHEYKFWI